MQRGDPMELNFEVLAMQKWNTSTQRAERVDEKKWDRLSSDLVYS